MLSLFALIVGVYLAIAGLELLNAVFDAFSRAHSQEFARPRRLTLLQLPLVLPRLLLAALSIAARWVSLIVHESAHAFGQLLGLGRPRIVLCTNGGFAKARPWTGGIISRIGFGVGQMLFLGFIAMAPLLVVAAALTALSVLLSPLEWRELLGLIESWSQAGSFAQSSSAGWETLRTVLLALFHAPWWQGLIFLLVAFLLAPGMTPSSVDFSVGRYHLLSHGAVVLAAGGLFSIGSMGTLMLLGVGIVLSLVWLRLDKRRAWTQGIAGFGLPAVVIAVLALSGGLGSSPLIGLRAAVAVLLLCLLLAAVTYVFFIALLLTLSLVALNFGTLANMFKALPAELKQIFIVFETCERCRIHFHKRCDGCGRSREEINAAQTATSTH
ncbi:MAG: hypothetical protein RBU37_23210 [Myxococcota bacterium]|jgi:hypothetical protein|nr:hypothetical protein [Myxococcota bacterium]